VNDLYGRRERRRISLPARRAIRSDDEQSANPLSASRKSISNGRPHRLRENPGFIAGDFLDG
jgi:hypothetical protein